MKRRLAFFTISMLLAGTMPALAADIAVRSKIDKVTVFQSGAEIAQKI